MSTTAVLIISDHNVSELVTVLHYKPSTVVLIASQLVRNKGALERFARVVRSESPGTLVVCLPLDGEPPFEGNTFEETTVFIQRSLVPQLQLAAQRGDRIILNVTGGNKPQAALTMMAWHWDQVHYISHERIGLNIETFSIGAEGRTAGHQTVRLERSPVSPLQHAMLYSGDVTRRPPNAVSLHPLSLGIAETMMRWQDTSGDTPWWWLSTRLGDLWFPREGIVTASPVIRYEEAGVHAADVRQMIELLASLSEGRVVLESDRATIPCKRKGPTGEWIDWVSGFWFEQWVKHHLEVRQVVGSDLECNLQVSTEVDRAGRETDMAIQVGGRVRILELKVDLPLGKHPRAVVDEFKSNTAFGKAERFLVVCSGYTRNFKPEQKESLIAKCRDAQIRWVEVASPGDLEVLLR